MQKDDLIYRQQAIDALGEEPKYKPSIIKTYAEGRNDQWFDDVAKLTLVPSAQPEKTCCGYDEKELIAFAIACRRNEVDEKDLKTFAQDCEFAWRVMQEEFESKIREAFEKWTGGKSDAD